MALFLTYCVTVWILVLLDFLIMQSKKRELGISGKKKSYFSTSPSIFRAYLNSKHSSLSPFFRPNLWMKRAQKSLQKQMWDLKWRWVKSLWSPIIYPFLTSNNSQLKVSQHWRLKIRWVQKVVQCIFKKKKQAILKNKCLMLLRASCYASNSASKQIALSSRDVVWMHFSSHVCGIMESWVNISFLFAFCASWLR